MLKIVSFEYCQLILLFGASDLGPLFIQNKLPDMVGSVHKHFLQRIVSKHLHLGRPTNAQPPKLYFFPLGSTGLCFLHNMILALEVTIVYFLLPREKCHSRY